MVFLAEKLFLNNSYLRSCEAKVLFVKGTKVVLDKTVFYSQSGGQPSDSGVLLRGEEKFMVLSVINENGEVLHEVDKEGLIPGDVVSCSIDWEKRYSLMRMHTSAHILAAVIHKELGALITGNQLGEKESRMDFDAKEFDKSYLLSLGQKANSIVEKDLSIYISFEEREKALLRPQLFRLKDVLPKNIPVLRIISIGDFDIQADGGTHVHSTKEVGRIEIFDLKNKGAENRRIYWKLV